MNTVPSPRDLRTGLLAGASTGIFWGVPFLAPQVLTGFSPVEIAFGRFFFFGVLGFLFFGKGLSILRGLGKGERLQVLGLSATGFWFYSSVLFWAISRTDGVISSLILGLLPVTIPLCTPGRRSGGAAFHAGIALIGAGLLVLLRGPVLPGARDLPGVAGLFACLAMWTLYAIWNTRFLTARPHIPRRDFSSLMGMISLVCLAPVLLLRTGDPDLFDRPGWGGYLAVSAVLGIGSSWFANWLWNIASARIPSSISGTLLVFETLFGLLYTFCWQARWPHGFEAVSMILCLSGVAIAIRAQIPARDQITS